jgi:Rrf2 family protein
MLKFSKKLEYALISIFEMSDRNGDEPVTTKEISKNYHIPQEILGKVLQALAKKRIIHSIQGVKGGYKLNQSLKDLNIIKVVEAVEGPITLTACNTQALCSCEQLIRCNIRSPMEMIQSELIQFFSDISLEALRNRNMKTFAGISNRV